MRLSVLVLLTLAACKDKGGVTPLDDTGGGDGGATDGGVEDGGTSDGGTDGGTGDGGGDGGTPPEPGVFTWTAGPDLPDCTPAAGSSSSVALSGVVLTPSGPQAGYLVYDADSGEIECAGEACSPGDAQVVCTEGVISAGLVDAHDHLQYNVTPPWQHGTLFEDRYDWRSADDYWDYRTAYDEIEDAYVCEIMRWAELRVLVGGGTAAVGSSGDECIEGLVRNLDEGEAEHMLDGYELYYSSSTVTDIYEEGDGDYYQGELASGETDAMLNHVAEGVDGSGTGELAWMETVEMVGPGMAYVHATDATTTQLARMAVDGTSIVWSPRSNLDLYAQTTPADIAQRMGVTVALGPDWTWSGSMNPAHEASCAVEYLGARGNPLGDVAIHAMITDDAARVVGLDGVLGALEPGLRADIAVFSWSAEPYRAVLESGPEDVALVVVDGVALYGMSDLVYAVRGDTSDCETVEACTESRTLCAVSGSGAAGKTAAELAAELSAALGNVDMPSGFEYAGQLHGLWDCEDAYASCDPRVIGSSTGDEDADGVSDTLDLCEGWYDPRQDDHDDDGVGDACDPCPLAAGRTDCDHDAADIDGDGVGNDTDLCPWLYDDQGDRDADLHGDACDLCPDESNPGDAGCTATLEMVRNPDHEGYVGEGASVTLEGLVVTGVRSDNGYFAQDPSLSAWGGIYVYTGGDPGVSPGDVVTVSGTVEEYYDLTELTDASTEVTGTASAPAAIALSSPCDVANGTTLGEELESMVVEIASVTVSDSNPDSPDDYGEFQVDGCLRVDDGLYDFGTQPDVGAAFDRIAGVLTYAYSERKILPRDAADLDEAR